LFINEQRLKPKVRSQAAGRTTIAEMQMRFSLAFPNAIESQVP
jgi:hypothetical protein